MYLFSYELWKFFVFVFWNFRVFNFLLVTLGVFNFFVWNFTRGEMGYFLFFWKLQRYFVLVFWSSKVFNFFLVILGVFNFFCLKFHKWGNGVCAFLFVNFESFLFSDFEILESSILLLSFWGSLIFLCEVSQGERWGICFSSYEFERSFVLVFWSSKNFNFLLVILGSSIFCVKFQKQENEMCAFLLLNFEGFCFGILKFQSLQFASCHFEGFKQGK